MKEALIQILCADKFKVNRHTLSAHALVTSVTVKHYTDEMIMMRINRKTAGTKAKWFVDLSNQWKKQKWKMTTIQHFMPNSTISLGHNYSTQAGAGWFPDSRLLPYFPAWEVLFMLLWDDLFSHFSDGHILRMQVMTSHPTKLLCPSLTLPSKRITHWKRGNWKQRYAMIL